jgi:hypothetical protein
MVELEHIYPYFEYASLILSLIFITKYKAYYFYKYFILYLCSIVVFGYLSGTVFYGNGRAVLNIFTFFEFNFLALIYFNLLKDKKALRLVKILILTFNIIYFSSFYFSALESYTVVVEGMVNMVFVVLYFKELLNSEKILNYKKLLPFWISVGFLIFYLSSIPFFTLLYTNLIDNKIMFPILFSLIIVFHLCFIYGLVTCKKMEA